MGDGTDIVYRATGRLYTQLQLAAEKGGWRFESVSIGRPDDKTTWHVQPEESQADAQPLIDAFDLFDTTVYEQQAAADFADSDEGRAVMLFYLRHQFGGQEPTAGDLKAARAELVKAFIDVAK